MLQSHACSQLQRTQTHTYTDLQCCTSRRFHLSCLLIFFFFFFLLYQLKDPWLNQEPRLERESCKHFLLGITFKYDAVTSVKKKRKDVMMTMTERARRQGDMWSFFPRTLTCFHPSLHLFNPPITPSWGRERTARLLSWLAFFSTNVSMVTLPHSLSSASTFISSSHRLVSSSPPLTASFLNIFLGALHSLLFSSVVPIHLISPLAANYCG